MASSSLVQDSFRFLYPESWHGTRILLRRPHLQNWFFLFPISADGRRGLFSLWDSSHSFGFYLLPSPVRRFGRATICPCTPFFTHPVTKHKHLFVSILTWICYLRNWPRFLFQRSVLGLLIQIRRNSSNLPLLLSQWETTWQYATWEALRRSKHVTGKFFCYNAFNYTGVIYNGSTRSTKIWTREMYIFIPIGKTFTNVHKHIGIRKHSKLVQVRNIYLPFWV